MFVNCVQLNSVKIAYEGTVVEAPELAFSDWVSGVAAEGTFYYNSTDTLESFGFPTTGWTIQPF
jgi:hypothetical protein